MYRLVSAVDRLQGLRPRLRLCQQSWWVLMDVGSVVIGELAAWVVAVPSGREGAAASS